MEEADYSRCYDAALSYLDIRQRSESELRQHLVFKRKFPGELVERALSRLKSAGLVDDMSFARQWAHDRVTYRQRSRTRIRIELQQKGIPREVIDDVTSGIDDEENALKAGMKKGRLLVNIEYHQFYSRLSAYLLRQGYGGAVVNKVVALVWDSVKL